MTSKKQKINPLEKYEKITGLTYWLNIKSGRLISLSLFLFFMLFLLVYINAQSVKTPDTNYLESVVYPWSLNIMIIIVFILFIIVGIFMGVAGLNEKYKKYDRKHAVKLHFYELSTNPDLKRKNEILKYLTYNLERIEERISLSYKGLFLKPYYWNSYFRLLKYKRNYKTQAIEDTISFLEDYYLYFDKMQNSKILKDIGNFFENEDYIGLSKKLIEAEKLFSDVQNLKEKMDPSIKKDRLHQAKMGLEWFSTYGKGLVYILAMILTLVLIWSGVIPQIPI